MEQRFIWERTLMILSGLALLSSRNYQGPHWCLLNTGLCFNVSSHVLVSNKIIICDLEAIESDEDVREFVKAKIESLVANVTTDQDVVTETETSRFKSAAIRFHRIFNIPADEKLVNCMFFNLCFDLTVLKWHALSYQETEPIFLWFLSLIIHVGCSENTRDSCKFGE